MSKHTPTNIVLHQKSRKLEVSFEDDEKFMLPCEYLRVYSPSAAVRGHGRGQEVLQLDKEGVNIVAIEPVGNYAVKIFYDDGHNTGLYDWDLLYTLGKHQDDLWQDYLRKLKEAGHPHSQLQE